jgi:glycosyltransferase involved in cell wall biosynthesis
MLEGFAPHAIHIATEGPLGITARRYCKSAGLRFTTSYHTCFPEYIRMRVPLSLGISYAWLRGFHGAAERTLVATESLRQQLTARAFENLVIWPRGVDTDVFNPRNAMVLNEPRPIALYAGRVAAEKNLKAFLTLDLPGVKYVVGDGPDLARLRRRYSHVRFTGTKHGHELAAYLAAADVFVFPSRSDTYGLVMLEAMACGVPVAAYPVDGPADLIVDGVTGALDDDLKTAMLRALDLDGRKASDYATTRSWQAATVQFIDHLSVDRAFNPGYDSHMVPH